MLVAAWTANRTLAIETRPDPAPGAGETLVRVDACGICGSDLHFFRGEFNPAPGMVPGHEIAGTVIGGGTLAPGTPVTVDPTIGCGACAACRSGQTPTCGRLGTIGISLHGGLQQQIAVPDANVYALPDGISPVLASLAEPLAVCVRGVNTANLPLGGGVLVLGAGTIGLLTLLLLRDTAKEVAITARYPHQRELALKWGASAVFEPGSADLRAWAKAHRPDAVIETVGGNANTLSEAVYSVRPGGVVVALGVFTGEATIPAFKLVNQEIRLVGSLMYGHTSGGSEFGAAVALLPRYRSELSQLQTAQFPLERANEAFETALDKTKGTLKATILPNG
jgi:threonine dehydrogenase-like Zn-dependent dehydrogenase